MTSANTAYEAKADLKGKRKQITGVYGSGPMELPVGEYVVGARLDKAEALSQPFKVEAGARSDVELVLDAGVAAIAASGGYRIHVFGKKNIQGERKEIIGQYGEEMTVTLPAGSYLARVTYEGDKAPRRGRDGDQGRRAHRGEPAIGRRAPRCRGATSDQFGGGAAVSQISMAEAGTGFVSASCAPCGRSPTPRC